MKPLADALCIGGFHHRLIEREGDVAIYAQSKKGRVMAYEVIVVGKQKERDWNGVHFEAAETYPNAEQWGERGWTYRDLEDARNKFKTVVDLRKAVSFQMVARRNRFDAQDVSGITTGVSARSTGVQS